MKFPGFVGPSYTLQTVNYDSQRCVNLYPEFHELGNGKEQEVAALVRTPGLVEKIDLGTGPIRGMHYTSTGVFFVVSSDKLYKIDSAFTSTLVGTLNTNSTIVSFADNGTTLCLVDGSYGYGVTLDGLAFSAISDPDFKPADKVVFLDGYFIFNNSGSDEFFFADLNSLDFDALDINEAEGSPDDIVSIIVDHRDLWLFGTETTEVFYNSGSERVFERIQGAFVEHGCAAPFSVAKMNNSVFWLSRDDQGNGMVYMANGYQPQRISTHAVEYAIKEYDDISTAVAYTYQENGHHFYALNIENSSTTWVFDTATRLWHERSYLNEGVFERHRANFHSFAFDKHIVGDYENAKIYELTKGALTDNGQEIAKQRTAPHLSSGLNRVFYNAFQLDMEVGVGLDGAISIQGHDPQAMLQFSDDGGHTWSNEKWVSFGKIGNRTKRAIWRRLGYSRDRVFRITITDPVKVSILGAQLDLMPGAN